MLPRLFFYFVRAFKVTFGDTPPRAYLFGSDWTEQRI
jgi:hypothetical protein